MEPEQRGGDPFPSGSPSQDKCEGSGGLRPGGAHWASDHARDLFPLPHLPVPGRKLGVSRQVQRRANRIRKVIGNVNEAVDSLNWMAGRGDDVTFSEPSGMQADVLARLEGLAFDQQPKNALSSTEEALRALLRGGSPYDWRPSSETLASYQAELVSIPDDVRDCPLLSQVLPHDDIRYLEEKSELMLRTAGDPACAKDITPYWDPKLRYNRKAYNHLVRRLHDIGYFNYTTKPKCFVGIFFVWKSSRTRLRLITDARLPNSWFLPAPGVTLMTSESFGRFEVEFECEVHEDLVAQDAMQVVLGLSDVKDCFHRLRVPLWVSRYFAWQAVPAKTVGLENSYVDEVFVGPLDAVYPCAGSLCQGWSWSLYFAQRANEQLALSIPLLREASLAHDRGPPVVIRVGGSTEPRQYVYVYVDNLGALGTDRVAVERSMAMWEAKFGELGLELHASEVSTGEVEALGCVVDCSKRRSRITLTRLWKIRQALSGLLRRGRCTGRALEVIIGHLTFVGLMNRHSLSTMHTVYRFIQANYSTVAKLWDSVVSELRCFKGLLILLCQDWDRPWNPVVSSSDSSLSGYGVCHATWPVNIVSKVGRLRERHRFRRTGAHSARESALLSAGLFRDKAGEWQATAMQCHDDLNEAGWAIDGSFEEVPAKWLRRPLWTPKMWGRWIHPEPILILEARTVLKSLKRLAMTRYGHDCRQLFLCDSMPAVLSFERGRSKNYKLLRVLREFGAYCLARNIFVAIRWIPSELNISDEPSHIFDDERSKLLVDLLVDDFVSHGTHEKEDPRPRASGTTWARDGNQAETIEDTSAAFRQVGSGAAAGSQSARAGLRSGHGEEDGQKEGGGSDTAVYGRRAGEASSLEEKEDRRLRQRERQHLVRVQARVARKKGADGAGTAEASTAAFGHSADGRRDKYPGTPCGDHCCAPALPKKLDGIGRFCSPSRASFQDGCRGRLRTCEDVHTEVLGGRRKPHRGLHPRCLHRPRAGVWEARKQKNPEGMEMPKGVEKAVPISLEASLPPCSVVWDQLAYGGAWPPGYGRFQPPPGLELPPTWSAAQASADGAGSPYCSHHWALVAGDEPVGGRRHLKDRDEGRFNPLGLQLDGLPGADSGVHEQGTRDGESLELRLRRVPIRLSLLLPGFERAAGAVSGPTLRSQHRSGLEQQVPRGGQKTRRLGRKAKHGSLREVGAARCHLAQAVVRDSTVLHAGGEVSRGDHARPRISGHNRSWEERRGSYVADFFAGGGGVARAVRGRGFATREWELKHGAHCDLTHPTVLFKVKQDIARKHVISPCSPRLTRPFRLLKTELLLGAPKNTRSGYLVYQVKMRKKSELQMSASILHSR